MKDKTQKLSGLFRETKGKNRKKNTHLCLSGSATVAEAVTAAEILRQLLEHKKPVILDLTDVSEVDVSFIQLLVALAKKNEQVPEVYLSSVPERHPLRIAAHVAGIFPVIQAGKTTWFGLPLVNEENQP